MSEDKTGKDKPKPTGHRKPNSENKGRGTRTGAGNHAKPQPKAK